MLVLPGLYDKKLKNRWRGEVLSLTPKKEIIAFVYGDTLEEMRLRKYAVAQILDAPALVATNKP